MKLVFPPLWILVCGSIVLRARLGLQAPPGAGVLAPLILIAGVVALLWMCAPLKRVRTDGRNLYISNYFREITVPLTAVSDVTENRWINIHPVTIHFRRPTDFGMRVTFMPTTRMFSGFSSHPVVEELRQAVSAASEAQRIAAKK